MFIKPAYRTARALTYLSLGLFAIVFIVHGIYLYGFMMQRKRLALEWMGLMALFNFLGCTAYAFRVCCPSKHICEARMMWCADMSAVSRSKVSW